MNRVEFLLLLVTEMSKLEVASDEFKLKRIKRDKLLQSVEIKI